MSQSKLVFVFRHGETDWNLQQRFQGHTDVPLNDAGRETARKLIPMLRAERIETVLSSDLSRAFETGSIVADALSIPISQDAGLREAHLGGAQGLTRLEIEAKFGHELRRGWASWQATDADVSYPGGETGRQVTERVFASLDRFLSQTSFERVGIATHGGVIRRIMTKILPAGSEPVQIPNGVTYLLRFYGSGPLWEFVRRVDR